MSNLLSRVFPEDTTTTGEAEKSLSTGILAIFLSGLRSGREEEAP